MSQLFLNRTSLQSDRTLGVLSFTTDFSQTSYFLCNTLERGMDLRIPAGTYKLFRVKSPELGYDVLVLDNVPNRSAIEIHRGNYPSDSEGCILVGYLDQNQLVVSTQAHMHLLELYDRLVFKSITIN